MQLPEMTSYEGAAATNADTVALTELPLGCVAEFDSTEQSGCATERSYLEALGLYPGNELRVCKTGEPWIVEVDYTRIALTTPLARRVRVKK